MMTKQQHIFEARKLMRKQHSGVLATNSLSMKGFPFGSITPFLMTGTGDIIVYASDIAQHSRNMKTDPKVSLCVFDGQHDDSQANARATIMAKAEADVVSEELQQQYFRLFPQAKKYVEAHDFRFYLLTTERVRYIGGFGDIFWFSKDEWNDHIVDLNQQAPGIIEHMHDDHKDALSLMLEHFEGLRVDEDNIEMLSCFAEGFHYIIRDEKGTKIGFLPYLAQVTRSHNVRSAMVQLTKACRQAETV